MSYEPTTWKTGDVVTSTKLNKMEQGIKDAGGGSGGGALIVNINTDMGTGVMTMDKTWQEINNASYCVMYSSRSVGTQSVVSCVVSYGVIRNDEVYVVYVVSGSSQQDFAADSPDGYPTYDPNAQSGS